MATTSSSLINSLLSVPEGDYVNIYDRLRSDDREALASIPFEQVYAAILIYGNIWRDPFSTNVYRWAIYQHEHEKNKTISDQITDENRISKVFSNYLAQRQNTPLEQAAAQGNLQEIDSQIQNTNPCARNCLGRTPLHYACESGQLGAVQLLAQYASLDSKDIDKRSPFGYACIEGHLPVVEWILQQPNFSLLPYLESRYFLSGIKCNITLSPERMSSSHEILLRISCEYQKEIQKLQQNFPSFGHTLDHVLLLLKCNYSIENFLQLGIDLTNTSYYAAYANFLNGKIALSNMIISDQFISASLEYFQNSDLDQLEATSLITLSKKITDLLTLIEFSDQTFTIHASQSAITEYYINRNNADKKRSFLLQELNKLKEQCTNLIPIKQREAFNTNSSQNKRPGHDFDVNNNSDPRRLRRFDDDNMLM